jgi:glyoxylase-like metal-dependent hydrolase (beta-lactamase superfamily II)
MHGFCISVLQRTPTGRVKIGPSREGLTGGSEDAEEAIGARCRQCFVAHDPPGLLDFCPRAAVPQITFSDQMTIELGGTVLELSYVGRNHSDNSIIMRFPKERVLFAVDFIPVESVAFHDFPDAYIEDWIDSLQRVELMDFDILAPGHGPLGRKEHVYRFREYMQDLHGAVLQYAREGKSLEEMKTLIKLPKYEKWASYQQWFPLNIEGMYRHVELHRLQNP